MQMNLFSRVTASVAALALGATLAAGCATARGVQEDAGTAGEAIKGAAETVDVKTALISDATIDSSSINVDTDAAAKRVVLRGSVPTEAQKAEAEKIAKQEAPGYTIVNQLAVVPKQ
jgi:osmotically-inducible protein OsmY